jgi:hypothetical protein
MEYAALVTFITPDDRVHVTGASKAEPAMNNIAPQWKKHSSEWGDFYTEVHKWAKAYDELGDEHVIPHMRPDRKKLRYNQLASKFFNLEIWGTCFIKPFSERNAELGNALNRANG